MGAEIYIAVFTLLLGQVAPGAPDPRDSPDYHHCMMQGLGSSAIVSPEIIILDIKCAALATLSPTTRDA